MKNSTQYARKIKKFLSGPKKAAPVKTDNLVRLMLQAILEENAHDRQAAEGLAALEREFVDFNELRVSPAKDIVDVLGRDFPYARLKAESVALSLNSIFDHSATLSLEYLIKKGKRDVRKALREDLGLSVYAEAFLTLFAFGGHAIPVDRYLLALLKADKNVGPDTTLDDLQGFLERLVAAKDAMGTHELLRDYVARNYRRAAAEVAREDKVARAAGIELDVRPHVKPKPVPAVAGPPGVALVVVDDDADADVPAETSPKAAPARADAAAAKPAKKPKAPAATPAQKTPPKKK